MADMVKPILFGLPVMSDFFIFECQVDRAKHCTNLVDFPLTYCYLYANVLMYMECRLGKNPCFKQSPRNQTLQRRQKENQRREVGTKY